MTCLLALDAATSACSVALYNDTAVVEDFRLLPRSHTQFLLPMIEQMLQSAAVNKTEIDAIAFTAGPGSFTGLRVGCAVVQGLAFALNIPVLPVSTLQVMAQRVVDQGGGPDGCVIYPVLDARMGEVYFGQYQVRDGLAEALVDDQLCAPDAVTLRSMSGVSTVAVGDGWRLQELMGLAAQVDRVEADFYPGAAALLKIALPRFHRQQTVSAELAQPVYLRESVAWQTA